MTKKILSVVMVLCMMLTFVPFIGSAAQVIDGGYLMLDNNKAASGDGWSWENGVLTLSQSEEVFAIMSSVEADVVVTEDVVLRGALVLSDGGTITTGENTLCVYGGISGMNVDICDSNITSYSIMVTEKLSIKNSTVNAECTDMAYAMGIYSKIFEIENSVVVASAGMQGDALSNAVYVGQASIVNSVVVAKGSGIGFVTTESDNDCTGVLEITNSTVYAEGMLSGVATSYSYQGNMDIDSLVYSDVALTTPVGGVAAFGTYTDGYIDATYTGIADELGSIAKTVVFEANNSEVLPNGGDLPEIPELPEGADTPVEPDEPLYQIGVWGDVIGNEIFITVIAENTHDRVALFAADDTAISSAIVVSTEYTELEGYDLRQWDMIIDVPAQETEFVIKCRDEATQSYKNGRVFESIKIAPPSTAPYLEELYVGGVNALETPEGDGWYFDADTLTLTLDNCTLTQSDTYVDSYGDAVNAVIYACGDLNIEFVGENFIENRVEEIPEEVTSYGAIWIDGTYNDYAGDELYIGGQGKLTVGLAISQDVYKTGLVEFSFAMFLYNEYSGIDLTGLEPETVVDIYGGVIGVPAIYNVRPFAYAPVYANGNNVTAYKNIEGTMLDENGYDPNNNEAWRVIIETTSAGVDNDGILNIVDTGAAYGDGWSWENGVLTLGGELDFSAIYFLLEYSDAKIVLTDDTVLDTRAKTEEDMYYSIAAISYLTYTGTLEIETGDYTLTILNDRGIGIDSYGTLVINGNVVVDTCSNGSSALSVTGDLVIEESVFTSETGSIDVYSVYDYEADKELFGSITITNSEVYVSSGYEDKFGYPTYDDAMYAYNDITIENSDVTAIGTCVALNANNISIKGSNVSAYGTVVGVQAGVSLNINCSTVDVESDYTAISAGDSFMEQTGEIILNGVNVAYPENVTVGLGTAVDDFGYEYQTTTVVDAEGNAVTSVLIEPSNYAEYEIINGKLIITVVTEGRMNRVALYDANGKCIKTFNSYDIDENGNYVWTIKMDAPTVETDYIIKARDAATNSYKNGVTLPTITVEPEVVIESVEVETRGDKVYVIATTVSDNYDRIAIVNPVDSSYIKYTRNYVYDAENDRYVWTIFFDYAEVEGLDNLLVKARDIRNNRYNNAQAVEITVDAPVEPVIDVTITDYDENNLLVTVTTVPDLYRVKIAYADDATSSIKYAKTPTTKADDAWTWEMVIARPDETTEYAIDIAYAKAYARYFTYVTYEVV